MALPRQKLDLCVFGNTVGFLQPLGRHLALAGDELAVQDVLFGASTAHAIASEAANSKGTTPHPALFVSLCDDNLARLQIGELVQQRLDCQVWLALDAGGRAMREVDVAQVLSVGEHGRRDDLDELVEVAGAYAALTGHDATIPVGEQGVFIDLAAGQEEGVMFGGLDGVDNACDLGLAGRSLLSAMVMVFDTNSYPRALEGEIIDLYSQFGGKVHDAGGRVGDDVAHRDHAIGGDSLVGVVGGDSAVGGQDGLDRDSGCIEKRAISQKISAGNIVEQIHIAGGRARLLLHAEFKWRASSRQLPGSQIRITEEKQR